MQDVLIGRTRINKMNQKNLGNIAAVLLCITILLFVVIEFILAYNQIGVILSRQGKFKKAGVFFSKAIQIRPNYTEAQENIAILKKILSTDKS